MAIRIAILGVVAVALFAVLFFRLWALQVISGERYLQDARNNQVRTFRVEAPRGPILDRDRNPLVTNVPGTVVRLWPEYVQPKERLNEVIDRLSALLDVPEKQIRRRIRAHGNDPLRPVVIKTAVHDAKVSYLYEHEASFPGIEITETQLRHFEQGTLAAHILGYVSEITERQLERRTRRGYAAGDRIGQTGIESSYDRYLRGVSGVGEVRIDALGNLKSRQEQSQLPQSGNAVRLTIDIGLQRTAEKALRFGIGLARENGQWAANGGAVVALDPRNGEIRALASYPTFDPSIYIGRVDQAKVDRIGAPALNKPILNRATAGLYPPGSTFKPVTALAALSEGILAADDFILCSPERLIYGQTFKNWNPYQNTPMELTTALAASCDTYFYNVGLDFYFLPERRGHPLQDWAASMGFGKLTGIDVGPEGVGRLPTPEWRKRYFKTEIDRLWTPGHSVQLAIGQGDLTVTPLQMARFYALIANGGKLVEPHVVASIEQPRGKDEPPVVLRDFKPKPPVDVGLDAAAVRIVQEGLYDATHKSYGTSAKIFSNFPRGIAGKTGTAEKYVQLPAGYLGLEEPYGDLQDQAWWCGYGPFEGPELVVCVLIENGGHGGAVAAPVALQVFEDYFDVEAANVGTIGAGDSD